MTQYSIDREIINIFPYENIRKIQDKLICTISSAIQSKKNVVIEGANGLGKTVATLTACLPYAKENKLQILHLCRTNKQADRVITELKEIAKKTDVSGISIRGRMELCPHELIKKHCDDAVTASVLCGQLKKLKKCEYHLRMSDRLPHLKNTLKILRSLPSSSADILAVCKENRICPYEVIAKLSEEVDVIGASYQYLFNPNIREIFINRLNRNMNEILLIIDECHNIIDTCLDIASSQLSLYSARQALKEIKAFDQLKFHRLVRALIQDLEKNQQRFEEEKEIDAQRLLRRLSTEVGSTIDLDYVDKIFSAAMKIQREYLARNKTPRSFLNSVGRYLMKLIITRKRSEFLHLVTSYKTSRGGNSVKYEIVSLDARYASQNVLDHVNNSVHISGTIEPIDAYTKIVGLDTSPLVTEVLDSPYTSKNVQAYIINKYTTRLNDRTPENYQQMCKIIGEAVNNTPANSGIFTASYSVMNGLLDAGVEQYIDRPLFYEQGKMTATANDRLVNEFKSLATKGGATLMGVLGGRSSEGADFPGEQMNTCIIVGIPYARPTTRIESQIKYLDEQFEKKGRLYGYIIPAIRRAAQAAGRPIRSINDKGLILFLDERFSYGYITKLMPLWLRQNTQRMTFEEGKIAEIANDFYS
jgi:DNA excision repair protein ERCC-2